jgi:hypothetical protein
MATQSISTGLSTQHIDTSRDDGFPSNICAAMKEEIDLSVHDRERPVQEQWNNPKSNAYRYFASLFAFTIMGMNDAAYGVSKLQLAFDFFLYVYLCFSMSLKKLYEFGNIA